MEFNTVLFGFTAVSVSASFIGCLIGYNIREKRHAADIHSSRVAFGDERKALRTALETGEIKLVNMESATNTALDAMTKKLSEAEAFIKSLREQNHLLEQGMDQATLERKQWEDSYNHLKSEADRIQAELQPYADAMWVYAGKAGVASYGSASEQLERIISQIIACAEADIREIERKLTDPNGEFVKKIALKAKREHGKKLRRLHERDMQILRDKADGYANLHQMAEEELVKMQASLGLRRSALLNTARDKLRLPAVRTAFLHAYWEEVARLRTLNKETK